MRIITSQIHRGTDLTATQARKEIQMSKAGFVQAEDQSMAGRVTILGGADSGKAAKELMLSARPLPSGKWILSENGTATLTIIRRWGILFNTVAEAALG
ncbi:MAG: hypothetical protein K2M15_01610 [Oscillospiraceae bacterium]|nr:hypothetical protein [Oscillospiraceae bacterium]MDE7171759.1 hypothetical protein [Oscillospiraceae bacterium]